MHYIKTSYLWSLTDDFPVARRDTNLPSAMIFLRFLFDESQMFGLVWFAGAKWLLYHNLFLVPATWVEIKPTGFLVLRVDGCWIPGNFLPKPNSFPTIGGDGSSTIIPLIICGQFFRGPATLLLFVFSEL